MMQGSDTLDDHDKADWWDQLKRLLQLSWANILTYLVQLTIPTTSTFFIGHLGAAFLAAATIGNMVVNAVGNTPGAGLSMALDTLASQANGARKYKLVGLWLQRSIVIQTIACIPLFALLFSTRIILELAGVDKETSTLSQTWVLCLIPGVWPVIITSAITRYMNAQKVSWPMTVAVTSVSFIHVFNAYLLVKVLNYGYIGAAIAATISRWLVLIVLVAVINGRLWWLRRQRGQATSNTYALVEKGEGNNNDANVVGINDKGDELKEDVSQSSSAEEAPAVIYDEHGFVHNDDELDTMPPLSKAVFRGWWEFLAIGVPSALSVFIEGGSWEVNAAITAHIAPAAIVLAGHSVLALTAGFWYVISIGVSVSAASLIGNCLGANEPNRAKVYVKLCYILVMTSAILNGGLGMFYRRQWAMLFSADKDVISLAERTMWVMWLYTSCDALKAVGTSLLRSCGRAVPTVVGNFFSCLIAGYPISWALGFPAKLGLFGIWIGMSFAWLCAGTIYGIILYRTNWQEECNTARERNAVASMSMKSPVKEKKSSKLSDDLEKDNN